MTEWELAVYIRESIPGKLWYVDIFSGTWKATVGPIVDRDAAVGCADKFNHSYGRLRSAPVITVKSARDDDDKFYGELAPAQPEPTIGRPLQNKRVITVEMGNNGFNAFLDGELFANSSSVSTLRKLFETVVKLTTGHECVVSIGFPGGEDEN